MQYPLISDYKTAVLIPETFDKYQHLKPLTDSFGQPIFAAGGPAVVFKMYDPSTNKRFALKCFLKHQSNRKEHFDAVGNYLDQIRSPYLCKYEYVEDEMWINESTYPVLVMDWIEGEMMSLHVAELCKKGDHEALSLLASKFDALGIWLMQSDLAHCDIKPDNILVTPEGDLKLVDYDGMYVPELKGKRSPELGTAEYRHPKRTPEDFGPQLDDFPILVLSLSLHSLAKDPSLYDSTINCDALMFRREDYTSLLTCRHLPFFIANQSNEVIGSRFSLLQFSLYQTIIDLKELPEVLEKTAYVPKPLSTKEEPEDGEWIDEYGVKYSADKRKLIKFNIHYKGDYKILEGTEVICDEAFCSIFGYIKYGCRDLTHISIPNSVKYIGNSVFIRCSRLKNIVLSPNVEFIGDSAFEECSNLLSIDIPDSVTEIKSSTFKGCENLVEVRLPSSVKSIGDSAFEKCRSLLSIDIPDSVTEIKSSIFRGCKNLTEVRLSSSIVAIGSSVFEYCVGLRDIDIPDSVIEIGESVFTGCISLKKIKLPSSVLTIGDAAFSDCIALNQIDVLGNNFKFIDGALYDADKERLICLLESWDCQNFIIPSSVKAIGAEAFYHCADLKHITIPNSVTFIGRCAFACCSSLKEIVLPVSITSIEEGTFSYCHSLINVEIPKSLTFIGDEAFAYCSKLRHIEIPTSVTSIGASAFRFCTGLKEIIIPNSVTCIEYGMFNHCYGLEKVTIPNSVTSIEPNAFCYCRDLKDITIPNSVISIGSGAFSHCSNLAFIKLSDCVRSIGDGAFKECFSLASIIIPQTLERIQPYVFSRCVRLKTISLPVSVTSIDNYAFSWCYGLTSVTINNPLTSVLDKVFLDCTHLRDIIIPKEAYKLKTSLLSKKEIDESIVKEL